MPSLHACGKGRNSKEPIDGPISQNMSRSQILFTDLSVLKGLLAGASTGQRR